MCSERQRRANQENAKKSTGPKTEAGKARSRCNALKHGLTGAGTVLPPEDRELFKERLHGWTCDDRPKGEMEHYLLASAVLASVRADRCARLELAEIARLRRKAIANWERRQERRLKTLTQRLAGHPAQAVARLEQFTVGCAWLVGEWEDLIAALESSPAWTGDEAAQAHRLLGIDPAAPLEPDDETQATLRLNLLALDPEQADPDTIDACLGTSTAGLDPAARREATRSRLPDPQTARTRLLRLAEEEIERLTEQHRKLVYGKEGDALSEAIDRATFDSSPLGALYRRYAATSDLAMHRSLNQLSRRKRDRERARRQGLDVPPDRPVVRQTIASHPFPPGAEPAGPPPTEEADPGAPAPQGEVPEAAAPTEAPPAAGSAAPPQAGVPDEPICKPQVDKESCTSGDSPGAPNSSQAERGGETPPDFGRAPEAGLDHGGEPPGITS